MNTPPLLPSAKEPASGLSPAWAFAGLLLLLAVARLSIEWNLPLPLCGLKRLTGIPCPFCGSTRCLQACAQFDFADAMRWNPLTFLACVSLVLRFALWAADRFFHRLWPATVGNPVTASALRLLLIGGARLESSTIWRLESRQNPHAGKRALRNAAFPGRGLAELSSFGTGARLRRILVVLSRCALIGAVLLNWIYLCLALP